MMTLHKTVFEGINSRMEGSSTLPHFLSTSGIITGQAVRAGLRNRPGTTAPSSASLSCSGTRGLPAWGMRAMPGVGMPGSCRRTGVVVCGGGQQEGLSTAQPLRSRFIICLSVISLGSHLVAHNLQSIAQGPSGRWRRQRTIS